ncbi:Proline racemase [Erwinia amylovora Ea644]|uniref:4-hydroxyproline epimerase n=1 Tax=Erwinia amylovora TaxID=552 RepID=UPI0002CAAACD|nr:4-hydroxyproline epimerase [Erwinia amylovora]CCP01582.1 Proline racemase [Erwinia amylovora Ea644]CCP05576.1 Proline racemase [Erwinia amylovora MR1]
MHRISVIDSHTGGEPTRLVTHGFPDLGRGSMSERRDLLAREYDRFRQTVILEPRGNDVLVGALLCPPVSPDACAGVIFFNNSGYLGMCGHGTIGLVRSLAWMGKISPGEHKIETPVGDVLAVLHQDLTVSVRNVAARRYKKSLSLDVPAFGQVTGDIAWGGNWFFLISHHELAVHRDNLAQLTEYCTAVQKALLMQGILGDDGAPVDHIELFASDASADSRSFVLCPGGAYDRSPCGTGTSARLACMAADNQLAPDTVWRQASVIGSVFEAWYRPLATGIEPVIRGAASICAETTLVIDDSDPFAWGIG